MPTLDALADRVILDGFHAFKHAARFGARIERVIIAEDSDFTALLAALAPDLVGTHDDVLEVVSASRFRSLRRFPHATGVIAVAVPPEPRPTWSDMQRHTPVIVLDDPRHHGNVGASVRIAAAGGAAGLVTIGELDPWSAPALRGSAGLHFALPVFSVPVLPATARTIIGFDPAGQSLALTRLPGNAAFVFGSERHGLTAEMRERVDLLVGIPMEPGVSSINLATSVAIGLYHWRLGSTGREQPSGD